MTITNSVFLLSDSGDEYRVILVKAPIEYLTEDVRSVLKLNHVEIREIAIERIHGDNVTNQKLLHQISNWIADCFAENPNMILFYQCDDMNPIPSRNPKGNNRNIPVQEYRSKLFSRLFDTYVNSHNISGIFNYPIRIDGVGYSYFIHLIAREEQNSIVELISKDVLDGFGK